MQGPATAAMPSFLRRGASKAAQNWKATAFQATMHFNCNLQARNTCEQASARCTSLRLLAIQSETTGGHLYEKADTPSSVEIYCPVGSKRDWFGTL